MLSNKDCFLHLPCEEESYEEQDIQEMPYFSTAGQDLSWHEQAGLGNMAYLIVISSAWGDVLQHLYRLKHRVINTGPDQHESFYREKQRQLQTFTNHLPPHLYPCNTQNHRRALQEGYV